MIVLVYCILSLFYCTIFILCPGPTWYSPYSCGMMWHDSICAKVQWNIKQTKRHILHWTQCTVNWSVTCFFGIVEQEKICCRDYVFAFYWLTYLLSVFITRTLLTYKNGKTKTKIEPELQQKRKCQYKTTLCPDIKWTPKEIAIMQQKLIRFVWNFRHMNNRANQQEMIFW